jgi:hypothetical protein
VNDWVLGFDVGIGTRAAFTPWIVQPQFGVELSLCL